VGRLAGAAVVCCADELVQSTLHPPQPCDTTPGMPETFGLYLILTDPVAGYECCAKGAVDEGCATFNCA